MGRQCGPMYAKNIVARGIKMTRLGQKLYDPIGWNSQPKEIKFDHLTCERGVPGLGTSIYSFTQLDFPGADRPLWNIVTIGRGSLICFGV